MPKLILCETCRQWFHASATRVTDVMGENEPVCLSCLAQIAARSSEATPSLEGAAPASSLGAFPITLTGVQRLERLETWKWEQEQQASRQPSSHKITCCS